MDMSTPWWFKAWFVFCAVFALGLAGFAVWAVFTLVIWVTSQ
jgi:hypothetical protein